MTIRVLVACMILVGPIPAQSLSLRIQRVINKEPVAKRSNWGIKVVSLSRDRVLAQQNADKYFIPASNTKLYSTSLALVRLGPQYRFQTVVQSDAPLSEGIVAGDLRLVGGGDPSMSWRKYPYEKGGTHEQPLTAIDDLAKQLVDKGLKRVTGNVVGDDTRWPWIPYPAGWAIDDTIWEYGAPVSALTINENTIEVLIRPAVAEGLTTQLSLNPPIEYYWFDNRVRTESGPRKIDVLRAPGARIVRLTGQIPPESTGRLETLAIDDPALYAAYALQDALARRGIIVGGIPTVKHRPAGEPFTEPIPAYELARQESRPLAEIVQVVNKVSQNLIAEMLLREVGFQAKHEGTAKAGIEELELLLSSIGAVQDDYDFRDGSGLSRLTLTTPATTIRLLEHMYRSAYRDMWMASMPIGGEDGTLENRFERKPRGKVVKAKTGTISHVNTLSGYIESRTHRTVAFSIMVNGSNGPSGEIRSTIDKICLEIAK